MERIVASPGQRVNNFSVTTAGVSFSVTQVTRSAAELAWRHATKFGSSAVVGRTQLE